MLNLSLEQLFGKGATQDSEYLYIPKSSLVRLTARSNNKAEHLLIAIVLTAFAAFEGVVVDEVGNYLVDETNQPIGYHYSEVYEKLDMEFWKTQPIEENRIKYLLSTFVVDFYIYPVTEAETEFLPDMLNY